MISPAFSRRNRRARPGGRAGPLLLFAAALVFAPRPVRATTYSVAPTGSDANSGTAAAPFRQIRKAIAVGAPGDTVLVADGDYLGFDLDGMAGTALLPFTIRAVGTAANVVKTTDRSDNRDTIHVLFSSYVVLEGLRSSGANRAAVRIDQCDHVTVRWGTFGNNATWGIFTDFSDDLLLEGNECFGSGTQHGIYVSNSGDRPVVRWNRLHDNAGCGLQLNADASQGGDGIISGAVIEGNIAWNNGTAGGAAINLDGVQGSIIRNNLLYGNHATGIALFQIDGAAGPSGDEVLNNTIDQPSDGRWAVLVKSSAGTNTIRNNILVHRNTARGGLLYGDATDVATTDSDYNVLDAVTPDDGGTRIPLATWKTQGHEPHSLSLSVASLFVSPAGADYHLLAGSAAIDAGQTLAHAPTDLQGRARPAGAAFDVGCYEWAAPSGTSFWPLPPCRVLDTRGSAAAFAGPPLAAGAQRSVLFVTRCGVPVSAKSVAVNLAVTQPTAGGDLRLFAGGTAPPPTAAINYKAGQTRANNAVVALGPTGDLAVLCDQPSGSVQVILDVYGYFQ